MSQKCKIVNIKLWMMIVLGLILSFPLNAKAGFRVSPRAFYESGVFSDAYWCITDSGDLVISGNGELETNFSSYSDVPWYSYRSYIMGLSIDSSIRIKDMDYWFYDCYRLTTPPSIPDSVRSMDYCFYECTALTKTPSLPPYVETFKYAFAKCTNLKVLDFGNTHFYNADYTGFISDCDDIEFVSYNPDFNTSFNLYKPFVTYNDLVRYRNNPRSPLRVLSSYEPYIREDMGHLYDVEFLPYNGTSNFDMPQGYNLNYVLPVSNPTKTGYSFKGWYTANSGGTKITPDSKFMGDCDVLYAQWTPNTYTVSFQVDGAKESVADKSIQYGSTYGTLPNVTRDGYTFCGWYTSSSGGTKVEENSVYGVASNQILYARWSANTYKVSFNVNGGSNTPASIVVTYGKPYGTLPVVSRKGYTFNGWYNASSSGTKISSTTLYTLTTDQVLYAYWTKTASSQGTNNNNKNTTASQNTVKPQSSTGNPTQQKTALKMGKLKIKFHKVKAAKGYQIQYARKKNMKDKRTLIKMGNNSSFTIKSTRVVKGKKYYVRVRAFKYKKNGKKIYGRWSSKKRIKAK